MRPPANSESLTTDHPLPRHHLKWAGALMFLFIAAYYTPLRAMVNVWATNDDYSYGFLIPVISVYLFWDMRHKVRGLAFRPSWSVLPFLSIFILISIYGILGSSGNISRPAIPIVFMLLFAFIFGIEAFKRFVLPLGFLIFMVPLPAFLDRTIGVFLKSVSSQLGGGFIRLSGMSVYVSGNVIDLGVTQLQVVDACSGLRFIFPLLALGILYAYFFEKVRWKQVFCIFATVPIAIFTNGLRIAITGVLTHNIGPEVAEGFFHDFSGWAIFMLSALFLFVMGRLLRLFPPRKPTAKGNAEESERNESKPSVHFSGNKAAFFTAFALLFTVGALGATTGTLPPIELKNSIATFPISFDGWTGTSQRVDPLIIDASGAEDAFSGLYQNGNGEVVSLYIGYRGSSFLENDNFFHSPTVCLPSSGWKTLDKSTHVIGDIDGYGKLKVTTMLIESMGTRQLVYFWFQTKNKATYDKNINRFHLTLHALLRDNTHDMFMRTITSLAAGESLRTVQVRMDKFVRDSMKAVQQFLSENLLIES
jgi:exosortase D (VPLPA-CTERM-specific)